ncbi:hypothetical protein OEZ86_003688 [Tetradesmus obliquus]|nr:hypothetical protein OEZ86_003688 [Tetradesmus obliquus]
MEDSDDGNGSHAAAPSAAAFTITTEKALSSDVSIACWCPTMDLCAVLSADGQLQLHRMDWQLLWAVSPEALITAVAWRPDGKQIAAGHANGAISVLDVETGDTVSSHKVHYAGISSITWFDQAATNSTNSSSRGSLFSPHHSMQPHQRYKRLFVPPVMEPHPPSGTEPLPDPYELCMEAVGPTSWPAERPGLSLLAAADVRGIVSLWLQGQVQIAELTAAVMPSGGAGGAGEEGSLQEQQEDEEERYKLLHVLATSQLDQVLTVNQSASGAVVVVSHSLQLLQQHQQPLQQCTTLFSQLQSFLQAAVKCVEVSASDWASAMGDFRKRFKVQLQQELSDHGSSITVPQHELLLLLATGCCTSPLQSFLAHTLGEAGLRRLARSLDSTASGLHTALLERLLPLLELVLFLLGELRGCVACGGGAQPPAGSWMGLQVSQLQVLELHAAALLLRTEQLRRSLTSLACQYRAFFTWLLKAVRQLEGQDAAAAADGGAAAAGGDAGSSLASCQEVLAFLKGQFLHDAIAPELSGSSLTPEAQARAEALLMDAIGVSIWEKGLAVCKATKLADESYHVEYEYVKVLQATDAGDVAAALSESRLASGVNSLFISWEPTATDRKPSWRALRAAISSACPGAELTMLTFDQRVNAVTAGLGRDIKTEALQQVAGSSSSTAWFEAQQFGTALNRQLFTLQSKLMREAAKAFLASTRCSNSKEARPQYVLGLARSGGGWFFEEALWMAVYGTSCHISSSSSSWRQQQHERARQQREQAHRQQQREEARQQRREQARRQQDERARQQHRQQQFQQARPAAAAELSAPEPDVRSMSEAELRAFLETLGMLDISSSSSSSSSVQVREVRKRFKVLALTVHPDKIPKFVQRVSGSQELFTEAFKALQQAHELLVHCCR